MKKAIGYLAVGILTLTVSIFLGQHSIEFFMSTFSKENQSMGVLGYMLTGGGFFMWMIIFLWLPGKQHERATSLIMMVICLAGELGTAIFNMYAKTRSDAGFMLTESDIKTMYMLVGVLAVAHAVSLLVKFAGSGIYQAFQDDDGDGIPNIIDRHDNRKQSVVQYAANASNLTKNELKNERGAEKGNPDRPNSNGR
jgi:hypothetical protein